MPIHAICARFSVAAIAALALSALLANGQQMSQGIGPAITLPGTPLEVALSPDGRHLAWVEGSHSGARIFVAPLHNLAHQLAITTNPSNSASCNERAPAWSNDGESLAFLSDCNNDAHHDTLYLARLFTGAPRKLALLDGAASQLRFSSDDQWIAMLVVRHQQQLLALASTTAGHTTTTALANESNVVNFSWKPGASVLLALAQKENGSSEMLEFAPASFNASPRRLLSASTTELAALEIAQAEWSPDGREIAMIAGSSSARGAVWLFNTQTQQLRNLTSGRPTSSLWLQWQDAQHLFVTEHAGPNAQLLRYSFDPATQSEAHFGAPIFSLPGSVDTGENCMALSSLADHSLFVFRAQRPGHAPGLYAAKPAIVMNSGLDGLLELATSSSSSTESSSAAVISPHPHPLPWLCVAGTLTRRKISR